MSISEERGIVNFLTNPQDARSTLMSAHVLVYGGIGGYVKNMHVWT